MLAFLSLLLEHCHGLDPADNQAPHRGSATPVGETECSNLEEIWTVWVGTVPLTCAA